jgi:glycosyltransferase involved in cell wall biosynthesis
LARQELPPDVGYEVLVVDNNSSDDTAAVARKFTEQPSSIFRYVFEPAQGLSFARNRGTKEARGEIVAFIDDDAIADPDWLAQLLTTYEREPRAACVGGKVVLQFPPGLLPDWYDSRLDGFLSARDLPYGPARSDRDFPHGVNISFRKACLLQVGSFYPLLGWGGRVGKVRLPGEETEMCLRLMRAGHEVVFQPAARVLHIVPPQRLRKEYFLKLTRGNGYLRVILDNDGAVGVSTWRQFDRYVKRWLRRWREHRRRAGTLSPAERFWSEIMLRSAWGSVWYCLVAKHQIRHLARTLTKSA